jgi:predicted neuraminidase
MRRILAGLLVMALATRITAAAEFHVERVFGPEIPTGPYKHPASITELRNGDLYLAYYGGAGEYAVDTGVFGSRLKKGQAKWSDPVRIAHDPFRSVGNAVVWQAPDGLVWLFYVVRFGETWSTSRIQCKVSTDEAATWSDASLVALDEGMMVRNRPLVLKDGAYLLPVYRETGHDPERVGAESVSLFLRFDPKARSWTPSGPIRSANGNIQPAPVQLDDGRLIAYCRRGGGYLPEERGFLVRAESRDGGRTWSEGRDSAFPNPNAAVDFLRLQSGRLVLIYNDCFHGRSPLSVAMSEDGDRTYPFQRIIAEAPGGDFAYPYAFQARDGKIHLVYTSDRRTVINHAVFDEDWVRQAK